MRGLAIIGLLGLLVIVLLGSGNMHTIAASNVDAPGAFFLHAQPPVQRVVSRLKKGNVTYQDVAWQDAVDVGINPTYFVRQINEESGFNPRAYSPAGAEGIAQFEPSTASGLGIDPWNPIQSLQGAAHLMSSYYRHYGNYAMALAAYNAGPGTLNYCLGTSGWFDCLPAETRNYINAIMG